MLGAILSAKVINYVETKYSGYVVNIIASGKSGTPDLICCIKGIFVAFEIKGTSDTEKNLQSMKINKVIDAGGHAGYVRCLADVDRIVKSCKKVEIKSKLSL